MKKFAVWAAIGLIALAGAYFALFSGGSVPAGGEERPSRPKGRLVRSSPSSVGRQSPAEAVRKAMDGMVLDPKARKRRPFRRPADMFANLSGRDRNLAEAVMNALDKDDFDATLAATDEALKSKNPEVRLHAVEALEWFGLDALPELTGAMADPDEEVAEAAEYAWEQALSEVNDASRRFAISAAAMGTLDGKDHLETICGHLTGAALELIDGEDDEEKASELRVSVVQSLVDIMGEGREANIEQAKEAYEDITGNEWISIDEAEVYLSDPDNYEPPEDRAWKSSFGSRSHGDGSETDERTSSSGDKGEPSGDDDDGDECLTSGDDDGPGDAAEAPDGSGDDAEAPDGSGDVETPDGSDDAAETPGAADDVDHAQEGAAVQRR